MHQELFDTNISKLTGLTTLYCEQILLTSTHLHVETKYSLNKISLPSPATIKTSSNSMVNLNKNIKNLPNIGENSMGPPLLLRTLMEIITGRGYQYFQVLRGSHESKENVREVYRNLPS